MVCATKVQFRMAAKLIPVRYSAKTAFGHCHTKPSDDAGHLYNEKELDDRQSK